MIIEITVTVLWIAVAWPLVLAIPALHSRLPCPCHLATIPAIALLLLPADASLNLPWLLFGTGLAVDTDVRWILAMSVAIWFTAATIKKSSRHDPEDDRVTLFFLLTLAGNLGMILSTDLVSFFTFSTLMSYSFYGLLVTGGNKKIKLAGRLYIIFLILADVALFEALLLAASTANELNYAAVRQVMAGTTSPQIYHWMVFVSFILKAGIWPFHLWLTNIFNSMKLSRTVLLGAVPIAMALLGMVRWLPLGEDSFNDFGMFLQIIGLAAMFYATFRMFTHSPIKLLPAWSSIIVTGLFITFIGTGLAYPTIWNQYEYLKFPFIAALGIFLAVFSYIVSQLRDTPRQHHTYATQQLDNFRQWIGRRISVAKQRIEGKLLARQSHWHTHLPNGLRHFERIVTLQKAKVITSEWSVRIIMFVLLGLMLAWLAI